MKQKDVALIIVVVAISGVVSFFIARTVFTSAKDRKLEAEVVKPITTDFTQPSNKYFNSQSIDPTQLIQIGSAPNTAPFSGASQ